MDFLAQLDASLLSRLLSFLPQNLALSLAMLTPEWPQLVAAHLQRLVVSTGSQLAPLLSAAGHFSRLQELTVDAIASHTISTIDSHNISTEHFWKTATELLRRLNTSRLEHITVRGMFEQTDATRSFLKELEDSVRRTATIKRLQLEQVLLCTSFALDYRVLRILNTASPALVSLGFVQCSDTDAGARAAFSGAISVALGQGPLAAELLRLDLSRNSLGIGGAAALGQHLPCLVKLRGLLLAGNALGPAGVTALVPGLAALAPVLKELDLALNGLGTTGVEALIPSSLQLEILSLRGNWLGQHDVEVLPRLLQSMKTELTSLDLAQNKLTAAGVKGLLEQLPDLTLLRKLNLAENSFATTGFAAAPFGRLAAAAPELEELNLSANSLGSDDAALTSIAGCLPKSLKILQLSGSILSKEQLQQFLSRLTDLPYLERLSLVQARLDDSCAALLGSWRHDGAQAGQEPLPRLRVLDISGNLISAQAAADLATALRKNPAFKRLIGARKPAGLCADSRTASGYTRRSH
eukprot:TRINITY_DN16602_c0_g1_i2.p1 TRINITY_DN16602_c0_g1~~TRINITY_DN16602_c0_g1_i2.p1  ORF type:complete len:524 (-),score=118.24 TRINITY_DN16602_c0_g1_i2:621-2192(-)